MKQCQKVLTKPIQLRKSIFHFLQRWWVICIPFLQRWWVVYITISFFICMTIAAWKNLNPGTFSALAAAFGSIFAALKYKFDRASYQKNLFEERYKIFLEVEKLIEDFNARQRNHDELLQQSHTDGIRCKSYFLFGKKTYDGIKELCDKVSSGSHSRTTPEQNSALAPQKIAEKAAKEDEAAKFVNHFRENILEKFPELKIDIY
jgi:hypothetical protein